MTDIDLDKLEALADAAIRGANDGWKVVPSTPTPEMAEALETCESYCDSCHGTAFSGWSGYDAMMKVAPKDFVSPATILSLIASAREAAAEIERLRSALKPFADALDGYKPGFDHPDYDLEPLSLCAGERVLDMITKGHLRAARAAQMDGEG